MMRRYTKHITLFLQVRHIGRVFMKLRVDLAKADRRPYIQSRRRSLIQKSAILLDLWRDLLDLDGEIPACRFARTLKCARHRLCDNLRAVSDKDMVHLTSGFPLATLPDSIWIWRLDVATWILVLPSLKFLCWFGAQQLHYLLEKTLYFRIMFDFARMNVSTSQSLHFGYLPGAVETCIQCQCCQCQGKGETAGTCLRLVLSCCL